MWLRPAPACFEQVTALSQALVAPANILRNEMIHASIRKKRIRLKRINERFCNANMRCLKEKLILKIMLNAFRCENQCGKTFPMALD